MKPIKFKEQNVVYAENQDQYLDLPALKTDDGVVISCWKLSLKERIKILFTGKLWLSLWSFDKPLTPSNLNIDKPFLID